MMGLGLSDAMVKSIGELGAGALLAVALLIVVKILLGYFAKQFEGLRADHEREVRELIVAHQQSLHEIVESYEDSVRELRLQFYAVRRCPMVEDKAESHV